MVPFSKDVKCFWYHNSPRALDAGFGFGTTIEDGHHEMHTDLGVQ